MQDLKDKLAETQARGEALQRLNAQLINQLEANKLELVKICGQIELLNSLLGEEGENADKDNNC